MKEQMETSVCGTALGKAIITLSDVGVVAISFNEYFHYDNKESSHQPLLDTVIAVINGEQNTFNIPFVFYSGTIFQKLVWNAISKIPYGSTATYSDLAIEIGHPTAHRAVANACGKNPIAVLNPCHRVVRTDGSVGGYRWDIAKKEILLRREGYFK